MLQQASYRNVSDVALVSLLLTLDIIPTLF